MKELFSKLVSIYEEFACSIIDLNDFVFIDSISRQRFSTQNIAFISSSILLSL